MFKNLVLAIYFFTLTCSLAYGGGELIKFKDSGKVVRSMTIEDLFRLAHSETITVKDPNQGDEIKFRAYSVNEVMDKIYGPRWRGAEEALFTCIDGYQPSVPVETLIRGQAYFAVSRDDQKEFSLINKTENSKKVDLGPIYLIWKGDSLGHFWPYQVDTIDLTTFASRFPHLVPPARSSEEVKRGFLGFRNHCFQCHSINGNGGKIGPELNYPVNVTEYYKLDFLKKWINDPSSIRYKAPMPMFNPEVKNKDIIIDEIISYLKAMKNKKVKP